jgi:glutamine synthetase
MSREEILKYIKENDIEFIDLRFTDTRGKEQHVTVTAETVDYDFFDEGKAFDGSSIVGWQGIEESDMLLMPDTNIFRVDLFRKRPTIILRCTTFDPRTQKAYEFGPRATALRAEDYLRKTKIADDAIFGPETEFFIFDKVTFETNINGCQYSVDSSEAIWNSSNTSLEQNLGYHTSIKSGYFPVPPVDSGADLRAEICHYLKQMGIFVEVHHHEVATGGQGEIGTRFDTLTKKADQLLIIKYVAQSVAKLFNKSITFMPKPLMTDNGNGLHVHQSLMLDGKNIFAGNKYANLSDTALHYIGGIIKHGKALNALTNASVNSYRRLVPGYEAPIYLAYSSQNRSAAIRIPYCSSEKGTRIEARFPDAMMNPYLAFSAMLMAGLDGIKNKIDPGAPSDTNLYELSKEEADKLPSVCYSLENALENLEQDYEFLLKDDVFTKRQIERYITIKMLEVEKAKACTHPIELEMYYDL